MHVDDENVRHSGFGRRPTPVMRTVNDAQGFRLEAERRWMSAASVLMRMQTTRPPSR